MLIHRLRQECKNGICSMGCLHPAHSSKCPASDWQICHWLRQCVMLILCFRRSPRALVQGQEVSGGHACSLALLNALMKPQGDAGCRDLLMSAAQYNSCTCIMIMTQKDILHQISEPGRGQLSKETASLTSGPTALYTCSSLSVGRTMARYFPDSFSLGASSRSRLE